MRWDLDGISRVLIDLSRLTNALWDSGLLLTSWLPLFFSLDCCYLFAIKYEGIAVSSFYSFVFSWVGPSECLTNWVSFLIGA